MDLNIKKALTLIQKQLEKDWGKIDFEYSISKEEASATANVTLNNHDDDIRVIITVYPGGGSVFRAVFDKIGKSPETLSILNDFNYDNPFFSAFIRDDGYLELKHFFVCYEVNMFKSYSGEFLARLARLSSNEHLQKLTRITQ